MTNNTPQPIHLTSGGTIYEQVGGMETFVRLAGAFYARVDRDASIRAMFPDNLRQSAAHLALFLAQFFGGPTTYGEQRGHPRLRMRHLPFRIGQAERDAWVGHMVAAMDEVAIPEPARSAMCDYFERAATFLINAADQPGGGN